MIMPGFDVFSKTFLDSSVIGLTYNVARLYMLYMYVSPTKYLLLLQYKHDKICQFYPEIELIIYILYIVFYLYFIEIQIHSY